MLFYCRGLVFFPSLPVDQGLFSLTFIFMLHVVDEYTREENMSILLGGLVDKKKESHP